ncbi:Protein of unknown function [Gryllus bimaculatus]|nr:Protein of unknown function [Gryllus bimaculatus]
MHEILEKLKEEANAKAIRFTQKDIFPKKVGRLPPKISEIKREDENEEKIRRRSVITDENVLLVAAPFEHRCLLARENPDPDSKVC